MDLTYIGQLEDMLLHRALSSACLLIAISAGMLGKDAAGADNIMDVPAPVAKQLRKHKISPDDVSFYVHKVSEATPRVAFNARVPRNPASTIKALTTKAALDILGPTFSWKTVVYVTGEVSRGRLQGDLIVKGFGDPNLTPEALWHLLWGVRERGVETVAGDLILDTSYFDPPQTGRGDFDNNPNSAYNALPSALSVNLQTTQIHMMGDRPDTGVRVFTVPPLANVSLDNRLKLVNAPCKRKFHKPTVKLVEEGLRTTVRLTGTFAAECGETSYPRLMLEPIEHSAGAIVAVWRGIGGRIEGAVREGALPEDARRLHAQESPQLKEVIRVINKRSNNLMARTLFLTLGAKRLDPPGSLPKARQAVGDWLAESGLDFPELVLDNGSGLSRETQISALSMGRLLGYAYASPNMPEFLSSLSIAGVDGTMRKRFRKSDLKGHAHVKTGTIRGSTGIVGYLLDRKGDRWIVVSLMNNPRLQAWRGKGVEDTLLRWVYENAEEFEGGRANREPRSEELSPPSGLQENAKPTDWFLSRDDATR